MKKGFSGKTFIQIMYIYIVRHIKACKTNDKFPLMNFHENILF